RIVQDIGRDLLESPKDRVATEITQGIDRGIQDSKGRIDATRIVQDIGRDLVETPKDRVATEITQGIDRGIQDSKGRIDATRIVQDIGRDLVETPKDRVATEITQGIDRGIQDSKGKQEVLSSNLAQDRLNALDISKKSRMSEIKVKLEEISKLDEKTTFSEKISKNIKFTENGDGFHFTDLRTDREDLSLSHLSSKQDVDFREEIVKLVSDRIEERDTVKEAILKLHPDIPGEVRVKILLEGERLYVRLLVSNDNLRDFIESNLSSLKKSLVEKGFELGNVDVYVMGNSTGFYGRNRDSQNVYLNFYPYRDERESIDRSEIMIENMEGNLIDIRL
ncbi:flagellar hook-length control protein FliK, partial [bacterium]|nr:flagellar hook-length control protein FliK [bacterium]